MSAPNVTFSITGGRLSAVSGVDKITVTFQTDAPYTKFECRATKVGEEWGVGKGSEIAAFSSTPANTPRTFDVYDDFLLSGDGDYRISLFVQGEDGSWNDNGGLVPAGSAGLLTSDGKIFLSMR